MKHQRPFEAILGECLDALFAGATVEACLARCPEQATELAPLLRTALEVAQTPAPAMPRTAFEHSARRMREALAVKRNGRPASTMSPHDPSRELVIRLPKEEAPRRQQRFGLLDAVVLAVVLIAITLTFGMPFLNDLFSLAISTHPPTATVAPSTTAVPTQRTPPSPTVPAGVIVTPTPPTSSPTASVSEGVPASRTPDVSSNEAPEPLPDTPVPMSVQPQAGRPPSPTVERRITPSPLPTRTPTATVAPSHTPTPTPTRTPTHAPSVTPTDTPAPTWTPSKTPAPTSTPAPVTFSGEIMHLPAGGVVGTWVVNTYEYGVVRLQVTSQTQVEPQGAWLRPGDSLSAVARPAGEDQYVALQVQISAQEETDWVLLEGRIERVDPQASPIYILVSGVTIHISAETDVQGPLRESWMASVEGQRQAGGSILAARIRTTEPVVTPVPPVVETPTGLPTLTPPVIYTPAPTDTPTAVITPTATFEPTETPAGTDTPMPTATAAPSSTPWPTVTPVLTEVAVPTATPYPSPTPVMTPN